MRAEVDGGFLCQARREIDLTLRRAAQSLRAYSADGDTRQLEFARSGLRMARGALRMAGLRGAARVGAELQEALAGLEHRAPPRALQILELAEETFAALAVCPQIGASGSVGRALSLFPLYRKLCAAREEPDADPVDLFFPRRLGRLPARGEPFSALEPEALARAYRAQRASFQGGLLRWLRGETGGAEDMAAAVGAVERLQEAAGQRAFWWVAGAFFDGLAARSIAPDERTRRLCSRIDRLLRRHEEGGSGFPERMLREVLYQVAQASPSTPRLLLVREAYGLQAAPPSDPGAPPRAREVLMQAKEAWNQYASGDAQGLAAFLSLCGVLGPQAERLGNADLAALAQALAAIADWLRGDAAKMSEAVALEGATALLLFEHALDDIGSLGAEFGEQSRFICARLRACVSQELLRTAPTIPLLDELSRKAQDRLLRNQAAAEFASNALVVERLLEASFSDPGVAIDPYELGGLLRKLGGAFEVLGDTRAGAALAECEARIGRVLPREGTQRGEEFERIAETLCALGWYAEALAAGITEPDLAARRVPEEGDEAQGGGAPPCIEAQLLQGRRRVREWIRDWDGRDGGGGRTDALKQCLIAIQRDADLVADSALERDARLALRELEVADGTALGATLAGALAAVASGTRLPPLSPEAEQLAAVGEERISAALSATLLEEAGGLLAEIREDLQRARGKSRDEAALPAIRCALRRLKEGALVVGLEQLGRAAAAVERAMIRHPRLEQDAAPELLSLIQAALGHLSQSVARLDRGESALDAAVLVERAAILGDGVVADGGPHEAGEGSAPATPAGDGSIAMQSRGEPATAPNEIADEAPDLLRTMAAEKEVLMQQAIVTDDLLAAVRRLGDMARAAGLQSVLELSVAFEDTMQLVATTSVSEDEERLVGEVIEALSTMVGQISARAEPDARPDLVELLRRASCAALVKDDGPDLLPEEEGGLSREGEAAGVAADALDPEM